MSLMNRWSRGGIFLPQSRGRAGARQLDLTAAREPLKQFVKAGFVRGCARDAERFCFVKYRYPSRGTCVADSVLA